MDVLGSDMTTNFFTDDQMAANMACNLLPCCVYTTRKGYVRNS